MPDYTFHTLSPADFEDLACDLLEIDLGMKFQAFTKGPDLGIDLLNAIQSEKGVIVQCKNYSGEKFPKLKSNIARQEKPKLDKLKPDRYVVFTSVGLTPPNKAELLEILKPYCHSTQDIYGRDDINKLLRQNPSIEEAHYKLWLSSTRVLQQAIRHGTAVWNTMAKEDIERKMSLYVQTDAYGTALNILSKHNYCVLSGIPGIGKTTLAQVLVTRLIDEGYELVAVRDDIQEAINALDLSSKQVVYYDDFLGQSSISERLGKNEDHGIVRLLKEARHAKQLKIILTTREYILEDAKRIYEPLNAEELDVGKCIVKVEDYTRGLRARILYNHVYFSELPRSYAVSITKERAYRKIIDHKGYSPRIVEWMTIGGGSKGISPKSYVEEFVKVLDNPTQLWQHAFEHQISVDARAILYCLGTIEGWFGLDELRSVWERLTFNKPEVLESKKRFMDAMKYLDGSFVRTVRARSETVVTFHNPSITDYVRKRIVSDAEVHVALLRNAMFFEQVSSLVRLTESGHVGRDATDLVQDGSVLTEAIDRTLDAKSATYQMIQYRADGARHLVRVGADIGRRLSLIANWGLSNQSDELISQCCRIASSMVEVGEYRKAATVESLELIGLILNRYPNDDEKTAFIKPFLSEIASHMSDSPIIEDWEIWTDFVLGHKGLFSEDEMDEWSQKVDTFCEEEVEVIVENMESTSHGQEWYDQVESIATKWDLSLEYKQDYFYERLGDMERAEEMQYDGYEDFRGGRPVDRMGDSDAAIDQLFDSLDHGDDID